MKAEDLKSWLCEATREKDPDTEAWDKVVSVMQLAFWDGYILEAMMWKTLVIIAKVDGGYKCMGLVEAIWKFCTSIINSRLRSSIFLHDALHGFRQGGGRDGDHGGKNGATTCRDSSQAIVSGIH